MVSDKSLLENPVGEALVVGALYQQPDLYVTYGHQIKAKYDFADEATRFFYNCFEIFYQKFSSKNEEVSQEKLNTFMAQSEDRLLRYKEYGGFETIRKWMEHSDASDIANYFDTLKKYSLLRFYDTLGFNVEKLLKFVDSTDLKTIYKSVRGLVDKVYSTISTNEDAVELGEEMSEEVESFLLTPQMGLEYPWYSLTEMFRGMRPGKVVLNGYLSNEGKSRNLMMLMAWVTLVKGEKFLLMSNEMVEEDLKSALLTTVINNQCFKDLHGIDIEKKEGDVVLGVYRDKEGQPIVRKKDDDDNFIETEEDYVARIKSQSPEFAKVYAVAKWIEENGKDKILFKNVGGDYSDQTLEHEIKRYNIIHGVKYFGYDTLKGYRTDDWQTLKQTTTRLKEVMNETGGFMWAVFQLTDDTVFTNIFDLSSNNIANAKQIKHVVDYLLLGKRIPHYDYHKYEFVRYGQWGKPQKEDLDSNKQYFVLRVDKNRGGSKHINTLFEYDLDLNTWDDIGNIMLKVEEDF